MAEITMTVGILPKEEPKEKPKKDVDAEATPKKKKAD